MADVGFLDSKGEKRLPVGGKVPAKLRNFLFALLKRLTHALDFSTVPQTTPSTRQSWTRFLRQCASFPFKSVSAVTGKINSDSIPAEINAAPVP